MTSRDLPHASLEQSGERMADRRDDGGDGAHASDSVASVRGESRARAGEPERAGTAIAIDPMVGDGDAVTRGKMKGMLQDRSVVAAMSGAARRGASRGPVDSTGELRGPRKPYFLDTQQFRDACDLAGVAAKGGSRDEAPVAPPGGSSPDEAPAAAAPRSAPHSEGGLTDNDGRPRALRLAAVVAALVLLTLGVMVLWPAVRGSSATESVSDDAAVAGPSPERPTTEPTEKGALGTGGSSAASAASATSSTDTSGGMSAGGPTGPGPSGATGSGSSPPGAPSSTSGEPAATGPSTTRAPASATVPTAPTTTSSTTPTTGSSRAPTTAPTVPFPVEGR